MLDVPLWLWVATLATFVAILAIDLYIGHRRPGEVTTAAAARAPGAPEISSEVLETVCAQLWEVDQLNSRTTSMYKLFIYNKCVTFQIIRSCVCRFRSKDY